VSVVAHQGDSLDAGHYVCYVQTRHGWYLCDDTMSSPQPVDFADLHQNDYDPYILLYQRASMALNARKPTLIGPWRRNNCFLDASMQLLFNLPVMEHGLQGPLSSLEATYSQYKASSSTFSINYHRLGYRQAIYGTVNSQEDPSALLSELLEHPLFAIKEWKVWPDGRKTSNAFYVLLVDWKFILEHWPKHKVQRVMEQPVEESKYQALCNVRFNEASLGFLGSPFTSLDCIKL
jgi:hypothetical protein